MTAVAKEPAAPAAFGVAGRGAVATGARLCARWAPEVGEGRARRGGPIARLAFADATIGRYFGSGQAPREGVRPRARLGRLSQLAATSWVFPFPWFADELAWLAAARAAGRALSPAAGTARRSPVPPAGAERRAPLPASRRELPALPLPAVYVAPSWGESRRETAAAGPLGPFSPLARHADVAQVVLARARRLSAGPEAVAAPSAGANDDARSAATFRGAVARDTDDKVAVAKGAVARPVGKPALAFGPRVVMPAGLGGALATLSRPGPAPRGRSSVLRGEMPLHAIAAMPMPAALAHLAWADRALFRAAGAPAEAMPLAPAGSRRLAQAPAAIYVAPADAASPRRDRSPLSPRIVAGQRVAPATRASAEATRPATGQAQQPKRAPVFDDDARVSDDVLAAIARAASAPATSAPAASASAKTVSPSPEPPGDPATPEPALSPSIGTSPVAGLLARPVAYRGAGLSPALTASPAAPALTPVVGARLTEAPFDVRALSLEAFWAPAWMPAARGDSLAAAASQVPGLGGRPYAGAADFAMPVIAGVPASELAAGPQAQSKAAPETPARAATDIAAPAASDQAVPTTPAMSAPDRWDVQPTIPAAAAPAASTSFFRIDRRPGALSAAAETFAGDRAERVQDLALDFASPELIVAAARLGLAPAEAAAAVRAAASGPARLSALAGSVEMALVRAIETRHAGPADPVAMPARADSQPGAPAAASGKAASPRGPQAAAVRPSFASMPARAARRARGATLFPPQAARALGLDKIEAGSSSLEHQALDIVAALTMVHAAPWPVALAARPAAGRDVVSREAERVWLSAHFADAGQNFGHLAPGQIFGLSAGQVSGPRSGGAASPLSSRTGSNRLPLIERAARASKKAAAQSPPPGARPSARLRAQAAWSVFPEILRGDLSGGPRTREARNLAQASPASAARRRADAEMAALVAPAGPAKVAKPAKADPASPEAAARAAAALGQTAEAGHVPDWLHEAAQKLLADSPGDGDLSLAELTLVTAAPPSQKAARTRGVSTAPSGPAPSTAASGHRAAPAASEEPDIDIESLARDVYDEVRRLMELSQQRNGDPWRKHS